jgi:ribokinase
VAKGVKQVVITLGSRGCLVVDKDSSHHIPAPKVKAVDTTGAGNHALLLLFLWRKRTCLCCHMRANTQALFVPGDCFVGAMLYFLARGRALKEACTLATKVSGMPSNLARYHALVPSDS